MALATRQSLTGASRNGGNKEPYHIFHWPIGHDSTRMLLLLCNLGVLD